MLDRLLLASSLVACAVALALAPTAQASTFLRPGLHDDAEVLFGDPDRVFPILQQVHTKLLRVNLRWGGPHGVAEEEPTDPTDPYDPAYDWRPYDRAVKRAGQIGVSVIFTILGTPSWASGAPGSSWNVAPARAIDLRRFAVAAARRYSGTRIDDVGERLPRVRLWTAWNEPNNPVFLKPQWARNAAGDWFAKSAVDYARICNAVVAGVKAVQRTARVACGDTAPRGNNNPSSSRPSVAPVAFLEGMWKAGARGFDAFAHHPYYGQSNETPDTPPPLGLRGQPSTAVTLGNFEVIVKAVADRYGPSMRLWVTEYGYQTNPPDKLVGVSFPDQARYMEQAYRKLKRNSRVDVFIWFLLRDEGRTDGWQSGLYTRGWKRKDARETFERLGEM
ncbi:MAG: glycosyl hydrolase [Gaiella sp.]